METHHGDSEGHQSAVQQKGTRHRCNTRRSIHVRRPYPLPETGRHLPIHVGGSCHTPGLQAYSIVHLYKRKGNRQSCDNHRGISLLSKAGKIIVRVLLNRFIQHLEQGHLLESECGFRAGGGTVDMIIAATQIQEKCQKQNRDLYTTFVDLTKAFDTVRRQRFSGR